MTDEYWGSCTKYQGWTSELWTREVSRNTTIADSDDAKLLHSDSIK